MSCEQSMSLVSYRWSQLKDTDAYQITCSIVSLSPWQTYIGWIKCQTLLILNQNSSQEFALTTSCRIKCTNTPLNWISYNWKKMSKRCYLENFFLLICQGWLDIHHIVLMASWHHLHLKVALNIKFKMTKCANIYTINFYT